MQEENKSSIGSIIGTIVIIAIIILGGLYFWGKRVEESKLRQSLVNDSSSQSAPEMNEASVIKSITNSDELDAIQSDLNNTKVEGLGTELNN